MRLYKAQDVTAECADDDANETVFWEDESPAPTTEAEGAPAGWDQHCIDVWGGPHEFFIPSDRPIYRSRSSAQDRVNLINRWGGHAVLVETDTNWTPVTVANQQRKKARLEERRAKALADVIHLDSQIDAIERSEA